MAFKLNHRYEVRQDKDNVLVLHKDGMPCFCPKVNPLPIGMGLNNEVQFTRMLCNTGCARANILIDDEGTEKKIVYCITCEGISTHFPIDEKCLEKKGAISMVLPPKSKS